MGVGAGARRRARGRRPAAASSAPGRDASGAASTWLRIPRAQVAAFATASARAAVAILASGLNSGLGSGRPSGGSGAKPGSGSPRRSGKGCAIGRRTSSAKEDRAGRGSSGIAGLGKIDGVGAATIGLGSPCRIRKQGDPGRLGTADAGEPAAGGLILSRRRYRADDIGFNHDVARATGFVGSAGRVSRRTSTRRLLPPSTAAASITASRGIHLHGWDWRRGGWWRSGAPARPLHLSTPIRR